SVGHRPRRPSQATGRGAGSAAPGPVVERQIKRVQWKPTDRMLLATLRERIPRSGWAGLLVKPETVLGWHRALVRRKWAAYYSRPRRGRRPISAECGQLILRMEREYPGWGYFRIRGELLMRSATESTRLRSARCCSQLEFHLPVNALS